MKSMACGVAGVQVQSHVIGFLSQRSCEGVGLRTKIESHTFGGSHHRRLQRITSGNILC